MQSKPRCEKTRGADDIKNMKKRIKKAKDFVYIFR